MITLTTLLSHQISDLKPDHLLDVLMRMFNLIILELKKLEDFFQKKRSLDYKCNSKESQKMENLKLGSQPDVSPRIQ
jgi:hypothetical protein